MQKKTSKAKVTYRPLIYILIFILIGIFFFESKWHFIFGAFAMFVMPLYYGINQFFTSYTIIDNKLIIKELFAKTEIPIENIRKVENVSSSFLQKHLVGLPKIHQIIRYNKFDDKPISPKKELIFNQESHQLYFKD